VFFTESQDLRENLLHPGLTVVQTAMTLEEVLQIHATCLTHVEEAIPELPETPPQRSVHITKMSKDILTENSSAYTQFPDSGNCVANFSLPGDSSMHMHVDTNKESEPHTSEVYMYITFNDNKWCNLRNEDDPISYKVTFLQPDKLQWQYASYEDEMKSMCKPKV